MIDSQNPKSGLLRIYYFSKWETPPSIHLSFDGNSWATVKLKQCKRAINLFKIEIPNCFYLKFVFCNKDDQQLQQNQIKWDNPSDYCNFKYREQNNFRIKKDGCYAVFDHKVFQLKWKSDFDQNLLNFSLVTRLDQVLIGDDEQLAYFQQFWIENYFFSDQCLLIYCIQESAYWFLEMFHCYPLLLPDYLITSDGSYVYDMRRQSIEFLFIPEALQELSFYEWEQFQKTLNWNTEYILSQLQEHDIQLKFNIKQSNSRQSISFQQIDQNSYEQILLFQEILKSINQTQGIFTKILDMKQNLILMPEQINEWQTINFLFTKFQSSKIIAFGRTENDYQSFKKFANEIIIVGNTDIQRKEIISPFSYGAALKYYLEQSD